MNEILTKKRTSQSATLTAPLGKGSLWGKVMKRASLRNLPAKPEPNEVDPVWKGRTREQSAAFTARWKRNGASLF